MIKDAPISLLLIVFLTEIQSWVEKNGGNENFVNYVKDTNKIDITGPNLVKLFPPPQGAANEGKWSDGLIAMILLIRVYLFGEKKDKRVLPITTDEL